MVQIRLEKALQGSPGQLEALLLKEKNGPGSNSGESGGAGVSGPPEGYAQSQGDKRLPGQGNLLAEEFELAE